MRVCVVGGGGREHALADALGRTADVVVTPGNAGIPGSTAQPPFVMFHEFAHYLMHAPDHNATASYHGVGRQTRKEREADHFALVALIPRIWLKTRTPDEIIADEGVTAGELATRFSLFETYGV
jgi:hypothetical protein